MSVTYSVTATITRATQFGRNVARTIGMTSGEANKEFAAAVDLTVDPLPTFPILVLTPNIDQINFLCIQVTGGEAKIRLSQSNEFYNNIDLLISGTAILSGISLQQIIVLGTPSGSCYIEVFGMGQ
jgi:hypothetical protein